MLPPKIEAQVTQQQDMSWLVDAQMEDAALEKAKRESLADQGSKSPKKKARKDVSVRKDIVYSDTDDPAMLSDSSMSSLADDRSIVIKESLFGETHQGGTKTTPVVGSTFDEKRRAVKHVIQEMRVGTATWGGGLVAPQPLHQHRALPSTSPILPVGVPLTVPGPTSPRLPQ